MSGLWSEHVPLAPLTTLGVGGEARLFARLSEEEQITQAIAEAQRRDLEILIIGGGSNLVVADRGFDGLALQLDNQRITRSDNGRHIRVEAEAGHNWDDLVAWTVEQGLAGIECLSGIPGRVGAAPVQNIGAYGQELSDTLVAVRALDRHTLQWRWIPAAACQLGYRTSAFKGEWKDRYIISHIELVLIPDGPPTLRYDQLVKRFPPSAPVDLQQTRQAVLAIRRDKAMVYDPNEPDSHSAGSFFVNPVVNTQDADELEGRTNSAMPRYPSSQGVKLSAAWLIQQSGFQKGEGSGQMGLSQRHVLALVNRGGASARDVVRLAARIQRRVQEAFGIQLVPEPAFVGFETGELEALGLHLGSH